MIYDFSKREKNLIESISNINPDKDLTEDEEVELIEIMENKLLSEGFENGIDYKTNEIGTICEDIITKLTERF
ncbi:MAG: hypothetical protein KBT47_06965 [Armatimonadetes bacterium]|nr:hypothetical protein [Candidatus Hippobium faecium]